VLTCSKQPYVERSKAFRDGYKNGKKNPIVFACKNICNETVRKESREFVKQELKSV
jgi:hypothetical protein